MADPRGALKRCREGSHPNLHSNLSKAIHFKFPVGIGQDEPEGDVTARDLEGSTPQRTPHPTASIDQSTIKSPAILEGTEHVADNENDSFYTVSSGDSIIDKNNVSLRPQGKNIKKGAKTANYKATLQRSTTITDIEAFQTELMSGDLDVSTAKQPLRESNNIESKKPLQHKRRKNSILSTGRLAVDESPISTTAQDVAASFSKKSYDSLAAKIENSVRLGRVQSAKYAQVCTKVSCESLRAEFANADEDFGSDSDNGNAEVESLLAANGEVGDSETPAKTEIEEVRSEKASFTTQLSYSSESLDHVQSSAEKGKSTVSSNDAHFPLGELGEANANRNRELMNEKLCDQDKIKGLAAPATTIDEYSDEDTVERIDRLCETNLRKSSGKPLHELNAQIRAQRLAAGRKVHGDTATDNIEGDLANQSGDPDEKVSKKRNIFGEQMKNGMTKIKTMITYSDQKASRNPKNDTSYQPDVGEQGVTALDFLMGHVAAQRKIEAAVESQRAKKSYGSLQAVVKIPATSRSRNPFSSMRSVKGMQVDYCDISENEIVAESHEYAEEETELIIDKLCEINLRKTSGVPRKIGQVKADTEVLQIPKYPSLLRSCSSQRFPDDGIEIPKAEPKNSMAIRAASPKEAMNISPTPARSARWWRRQRFLLKRSKLDHPEVDANKRTTVTQFVKWRFDLEKRGVLKAPKNMPNPKPYNLSDDTRGMEVESFQTSRHRSLTGAFDPLFYQPEHQAQAVRGNDEEDFAHLSDPNTMGLRGGALDSEDEPRRSRLPWDKFLTKRNAEANAEQLEEAQDEPRTRKTLDKGKNKTTQQATASHSEEAEAGPATRKPLDKGKNKPDPRSTTPQSIMSEAGSSPSEPWDKGEASAQQSEEAEVGPTTRRPLNKGKTKSKPQVDAQKHKAEAGPGIRNPAEKTKIKPDPKTNAQQHGESEAGPSTRRPLANAQTKPTTKTNAQQREEAKAGPSVRRPMDNAETQPTPKTNAQQQVEAKAGPSVRRPMDNAQTQTTPKTNAQQQVEAEAGPSTGRQPWVPLPTQPKPEANAEQPKEAKGKMSRRWWRRENRMEKLKKRAAEINNIDLEPHVEIVMSDGYMVYLPSKVLENQAVSKRQQKKDISEFGPLETQLEVCRFNGGVDELTLHGAAACELRRTACAQWRLHMELSRLQGEEQERAADRAEKQRTRDDEQLVTRRRMRPRRLPDGGILMEPMQPGQDGGVDVWMPEQAGAMRTIWANIRYSTRQLAHSYVNF